MNERTVLILQARMGSSRLPGKSSLDLAGAPLLSRILERVLRCQNVDEIVLATTPMPEDDVLVEIAEASGVAVFRGSECDLVDRYYRAAEAFRADIVGRLPADNPVPEPAEIDRIVSHHKRVDAAFSSNLTQVFFNGYPDGIGAEMISFGALEEVWNQKGSEYFREHPHVNFFDYRTQTPTDPLRFPVSTIPCPAAFRRPDLTLDVNTPEEYRFMAELYETLYPRNPQFHITDIIEWYDSVWAPRHDGET